MPAFAGMTSQRLVPTAYPMAGHPFRPSFYVWPRCFFVPGPCRKWAKHATIAFSKRCRLAFGPKGRRGKIMKLKTLLLATSVFTIAGFVGAQAQSLSGTVSSTEEGQMEGVLVSAKKEGSTVTTTVVSNEKGEFSFPAGRLEPGKYNITTRAIGFTLVGPKTVDIGGSGATAEVKLAKARNIVPQLSNGEWLLSVPGSDQFKASFLLDCQGCHTLN